MSRGALYRDEAVVLRTYKLGEADRIVVLLTRARGKVRAVAKGVRKTKSKFGSRLEPTSHVAVQLYEGRELDIVTQAETIDQFRAVRDDLDRIARASAMLEAVDQLAQEGEVNPRLYQMLLGALRTLDGSELAARRAGLLLEGAGARGLPPRGRRLRAVRRPTTSRSWRSTSSPAACCAAPAGGAPPCRPRRWPCCR